MSLEKLRQREVHRYYQPWLESPATFDSSHATVSSRYHNDGTRLNATKDTALTAFAQLGCLRLNAKRGIITLIDSERQYILAEATQSLSLISGRGANAEHEMWFGNASIQRGQGVSHDALSPSEVTAVDEDGSIFTARALIIGDLANHPDHKSKEYSSNGLSFYCGVPITTKAGHPIGVYTVTDDKPRQGISATHLRFLTEMARVTMHHLETSKNEAARYRGETLARGLGRFVQGHSTLDNARTVPPGSADRVRDNASLSRSRANSESLSPATSVRTFMGMDVTTADPQRLRPTEIGRNGPIVGGSQSYSSSDGHEARLKSARAGENQSDEDGDEPSFSPSDSIRRRSQSAGEHRTDPSEKSRVAKDIFVRAANILRQCAAADGVLFFDATSDRSSHGFGDRSSRSGSRSDHEKSDNVASDWSSRRTGNPKSLDDHNNPLSSSGSSSEDEMNRTVDVQRQQCQVLGYSLDYSELSSSNSESLANFELNQRTLSRLVKHYPNGKLFFFDNTGFSSGDSEQSASMSSPHEGSSQASRRSERTVTAGRTRKAVNRAVAKELLRVVPQAQTVLWLPLWDPFNQRWAAGCFLWSRRREKLISAQDDLVYLKTFANSIMAEHARAEAAKVDTAKTTFIANISHELRTPLHGILGSLDVLQATPLTEFQSSLATAIDVSAKMLADTLYHVLDYAKINHLTKKVRRSSKNDKRGSATSSESHGAEEASLYKDGFDLAMVVEEVVEVVCASYAFYAKGNSRIDQDLHLHATRNLTKVQVALDIPNLNNWTVLLQPGGIRRILTNLLGNSMKYTDDGFVKISMTQREPVSKDQESIKVQLAVTDTGSGMSQGFIDHDAFVPFKQESSFSVGAGLGLSIVQQIVTSYGGNISITSQKGVGTEVRATMVLPMAPSPVVTELIDGVTLSTLRQRTRGAKMLLINPRDEDNLQDIGPDQLGASATAIEQIGQEWLSMSTSWASGADGHEADVYVYITPPDYDELRKHAKDGKARRKAPIIAITASIMEQAAVREQSAERFRKPGFALEVISHPIGPRKFATAVAKCLWMTDVVASENENENTANGLHTKPLPLLPTTGRSSQSQTQSAFDDATGPSPPCRSDKETVETKGNVSDKGSTTSSTGDAQDHRSWMPSNLENPETLRVLLVDDNAINVSILQQFMRRAKVSCDVARNGLQALEAYKAACSDEADCEFSHVLMDISMPVMDGITSTQEIRRFEQEQKRKPSIILALSGVAEIQTQDDILSAGANAFLAKPVKYKEILENISIHS